MLAAIAAGCCVMLKPSELAEASQALLVSLVPKYLDQSAIRLVTGGPAETGKYITAAAAKFLTPTVLELGGQGPAIVTSSANVDLAAKRIAYGKFLNAGQLCLSINHVFVDPSVYDTFVDRLGFWFDKYLNNAEEGYCRIINDRNFNRLNDLLSKTNGKITCGGKSDPATRFFEPTVVRDVKLEGE
jgi:aldehyde dehydrogenase (NAD+)